MVKNLASILAAAVLCATVGVEAHHSFSEIGRAHV